MHTYIHTYIISLKFRSTVESMLKATYKMGEKIHNYSILKLRLQYDETTTAGIAATFCLPSCDAAEQSAWFH